MLRSTLTQTPEAILDCQFGSAAAVLRLLLADGLGLLHELLEEVLHLGLNGVGQGPELGLHGLGQGLQLLLHVGGQGLDLGLDLLSQGLQLGLAILKVGPGVGRRRRRGSKAVLLLNKGNTYSTTLLVTIWCNQRRTRYL